MKAEKKYLEKPWLKLHEFGCLPETLEPYPEKTITEFLLCEPAKKFPNNLALVQLDYEMTYKELKEHVYRFATALSNLGVKKGDVVATVIPPSIQLIIAGFAITEIGAAHLLENILDSVDGMVDKFDKTNVRTVICAHTNVKDRDLIDNIEEVAKKTKVENIILTKIEDYSSNPPKHEKEEKIIWFTDLLEKYPPSPPKVDINVKKDVAVLFFTGGTTGVPKGVMHSHQTVIIHGLLTLGSMVPQSVIPLIKGISTMLFALPLFTPGGYLGLTALLQLVPTVFILPDPRDTKEFMRVVRKYHPLLSAGAPTQYLKLLKEQDVKDFGMLSISSTASLAPATQTSFEKKSGSIMMEASGLSEVAGVTHIASLVSIFAPIFGSRETVGKILHLLDRILKTPGITPLLRSVLRLIGSENIGRIGSRLIAFASSLLTSPSAVKMLHERASQGIPCVDVDMKVVDEDTGEEIPMKKVVKEKLRGELCTKGPHRMLGYWPNPGTGFDEEEYVHTGDVVEVDDWGQVYIVDRTKDMINVSGYKVYSKDMDDLLYEIPGVNEAATIGVPDPERPGSERVKVFISLLPEHKGKVKKEDIINYLRERVALYAIPKSVEFRDELPKTVTEKIFKRQLREEEIEKMKREGILK